MPRHVVVDGSNLATEGRTMPSLKQLNDAVMAFITENPNDVITVVVDATFGHRIPPSEVAEFDAAIENNELVCPPAGAIGRGDGFVIEIAKKVNATILSNDSYQEFHGEEPWLFDEGRLVGGKPVPNVGWVFVPRSPVRGPVSRKAVKAKKGGGKLRETRHGHRPTPLANQPMPTPKAPPPGRRGERPGGNGAPAAAAPAMAAGPPAAPAPARHEPVNELLPFLAFVEAHPVGTLVDGTVESYSSHGAYARAGEVRIYCPLRHMAAPPPRAAREVLKLGDVRTFEIVSFNPARRSVDVAVPGFAPAATGQADPGEAEPAGVEAEPARGRRRRGRSAPSAEVVPEAAPAEVSPAEPETGPETESVAAAPDAPEAPGAPAAAEPSAATPPARKAAKRARKAAAPAAEPAVAPAVEPAPEAASEAAPPPARKAAKRARKAAAPAAEPAVAPAVEPAPVAASEAAPPPARKAAKRARKAATPADTASTPEAGAPDAQPELVAPAPAKRTRKRAAAPPA